ncbi:MAG: lytic transglycosylase domain-containing protein [Bryobacteraceae bacterium]|jgi:soluble lytic murein transglycosylase-like protein
MKALLTLLAITVSASAGEYAVLANGQRVHAESHEIDGNLVRLVTKTGSIEFPAAQVVAYEQEEYTPPPPAPPAAAPAPAPISARALSAQEIITRAAEKAGLPPDILHSVARAESGYRTNAVSPKGAIGLMQLMPKTAAALNANPYDPQQNAEAGAEYLAQLLEKYKDDPHQVSKAVAAYNAGPGAVDKYKGIPPYRETVDYVSRVISDYNKRTAKKQTSPAPVTD